MIADTVLLPSGWKQDLEIQIDSSGSISRIGPVTEVQGAERVPGVLVPGVPNLHSHAFQRGAAGLAEFGGKSEDSFWTWRAIMYEFVSRLLPDDVEAIASQLYLEMLESGYTSVGEFHYLHNDRDGRAYSERDLLAQRVHSAAQRAGIGMTLLPVLYHQGGFGGQALEPRQKRFRLQPDEYLKLTERLEKSIAQDPNGALGFAPHSLRAVSPEALDQVSAAAGVRPLHIHVAEQPQEVTQCLRWSGQRPVEYLLEHHSVDRDWCLVHATHANSEELRGIAGRGAVVGLCPSTEANLGDGLFDAAEFLECGGRFGVGSDSHVSVSPVEELRWLEYGQRLVHGRRNVLGGPNRSTGRRLLEMALAGGSQALGRPIGRIAEGFRADLVVLDREHPSLLGRTMDGVLDSWIFSGNSNPVRDVMVGGEWVVREGRHPGRDPIRKAFATKMMRLSSAL